METILMLTMVGGVLAGGIVWLIVRKIGRKTFSRGVREIFRKGRKL